MTPQQKLKHHILIIAARHNGEELGEVTTENVDTLFDNHDNIQDAKEEARTCGQRTGIHRNVDYRITRHYEYDEVADQMPDGSWVGWTYWHGGGKHSEPSAIDWIEDAYAVDVKEEQKMVTVRTFTAQ